MNAVSHVVFDTLNLLGNASGSPSPTTPTPAPPHHSTTTEDEERTSYGYLLVCVTLMLIILCAHVVHKLHWNWLSESGAIIVLGIVIGGFLKLIDVLADTTLVHMVKFDHNTFINIILPIIIFEAGYSLKHTGVTRNLGAVLLYAVLGTLVSAVIIGVILFYSTNSLHTASGGLFICFAFGSLLSATDPVSVIALLGSRFDMSREPPLLYNLIFGESVLNDAVAIVLYNVFVSYVHNEVTAVSIVMALLNFVKIFVASAAIGYVVGLLCALLLKHVRLDELPHLEVSMCILFAACSYYLCNAIEYSGIMGVFMTARIIGHHATHNISRYAKEVAPFVFKTLAAIAECAVFFLLGTSLWAYDHQWNGGFCAVTILACLVSRAVVVFPISGFCNCFRTFEKIHAAIQVFMWYSGLRGAIAFGLAVILVGQAEEKGISSENASMILSCTLCVIFCTVLIMGSGAPLLLTALHLDNPDGQDDDILLSRKSVRVSTIPSLWDAVMEGEEGDRSFGFLVRYLEKRFIERHVRRNNRGDIESLYLSQSEYRGSLAQPMHYGSTADHLEATSPSSERLAASDVKSATHLDVSPGGDTARRSSRRRSYNPSRRHSSFVTGGGETRASRLARRRATEGQGGQTGAPRSVAVSSEQPLEFDCDEETDEGFSYEYYRLF